MNISLHKVSKRFGEKQVLEEFSLTLPDKGILCLFGPSGCGKSTLIKLLGGIISPDLGSIAAPKRIAYVFQEDRLLPWLTAKENVEAVMQDHADGLPFLEQVGLGAEAQKYPDELSGGMKRRVAIARALAFKGQLLLLDEPFQGLDDNTKSNMIHFIRQQGQTHPVVLITHDRQEALALSNHILMLSGPPLKIENVQNI